MGSSAKKRQTFAKMTRERTVRERRERKLEKKRAAAASRNEPGDSSVLESGAGADGIDVPEEPRLDRTTSD